MSIYDPTDSKKVGKIIMITILGGTLIFAIVMLVLDIDTTVGNVDKDADSFQKLLIDRSKQIYKQKKAEGVDFNSGPCLAENLEIDWVLDVVHEPRAIIDDLPENQCQNIREGKAKHFIELNLQGDVVRIQ